MLPTRPPKRVEAKQPPIHLGPAEPGEETNTYEIPPLNVEMQETILDLFDEEGSFTTYDNLQPQEASTNTDNNTERVLINWPSGY